MCANLTSAGYKYPGEVCSNQHSASSSRVLNPPPSIPRSHFWPSLCIDFDSTGHIAYTCYLDLCLCTGERRPRRGGRKDWCGLLFGRRMDIDGVAVLPWRCRHGSVRSRGSRGGYRTDTASLLLNREKLVHSDKHVHSVLSFVRRDLNTGGAHVPELLVPYRR